MKKLLPFAVLVGVIFVVMGTYIGRDIFTSTARRQEREQSLEQQYEASLKKLAQGQRWQSLEGVPARGQGSILLNFWAAWCHPCLAKMPELTKLQQQLSGQDFSIVGINSDLEDQQKKIEHTTEKYDLNFPTIPDKGQILSAFEVTTLPKIILFQKGKVRKVWELGASFSAQQVKDILNRD